MKKTKQHRFCPTPKRMIIIKKSNNVLARLGIKKFSILVQLLWKSVWRVLRKLKLEILLNQAIPLLGAFPRVRRHHFTVKDAYPHSSIIHNSYVYLGRDLHVHQYMKG